MNIDGINDGIVLDHIKPGASLKIYQLLELQNLDCSVALIQNVKSQKMGKKDIIKVDSEFDIDFDILGYVDPNITVNIVKNGRLIEKKSLSLPQRLTNVIRCKNPRCITSVEHEIPQEFYLASAEKRKYRCGYCDTEQSYMTTTV